MARYDGLLDVSYGCARHGAQALIATRRFFGAAIEWDSVWRFVRRNIRTSYGLTFLVEFCVLVAAILTLKLSAALLGPVGFGEYAVARRAQSILAFTLLCGLGISIPRYVAINVDAGPAPAPKGVYLAAGLSIAFPILLIFACLASMGSHTLAGILFGSPQFEPLVTPVVLVTIGTCLHAMIYGYFRGSLAMGRANILQAVNAALVMPAALLMSQHSAARALALSGVGLVLICLLYLLLLLRDDHFLNLSGAQVRHCARQLLRYGVPRLAGEFALFGLFTVPTIIVVHRSGIKAAGFFSLGLSVVQLVGSLFSGLGILLLPLVGEMVGRKQWDRVERIVAASLGLSIILAVAIAAALAVSMGLAISRFLGASFSPAVQGARVLLVGGVPFVAYLVLRNPLDAMSVWPYNSVNLSVALGLCVILLIFGGAFISAPGSVALTFSVLGALSIFSWRSGLRRARYAEGEPRASPGS